LTWSCISEISGAMSSVRHRRHLGQRQQRPASHRGTKHGAKAEPLAHDAHHEQQQRVAHGDAHALGNSLVHCLLHAAEAVGQKRLHHQHGQVDAKVQKPGAKHEVQNGICRQVHHSGAGCVQKCAGQQLFLQLLRGRLLVPQGYKAAEQAGQHAGGHQQQRHRRRQHQAVLAGGSHDHQRCQTHALHDHRVIQEHAVVMGKLFGVL